MEKVIIEVISGRSGNCLSIGNGASGTRVAGPKPWGGGMILHSFEVSPEEVISICKSLMNDEEEDEQ